MTDRDVVFDIGADDAEGLQQKKAVMKWDMKKKKYMLMERSDDGKVSPPCSLTSLGSFPLFSSCACLVRLCGCVCLRAVDEEDSVGKRREDRCSV